MPEFEGALGFPSAGDDLPRVPTGTWGPLRFASLHPEHDLADLLAPLDRLASLPALEGLVEGSPATDVRDYEVGAHWALYVENYLEGLHVPFVHAGLNEALDFGAPSTRLLAGEYRQVVPRLTNSIREMMTRGELARAAYWLALLSRSHAALGGFGDAEDCLEQAARLASRLIRAAIPPMNRFLRCCT